MFDLDNWQEIWVTITRNKVRSILTGFGVMWGILMLIILVGIGNGFKGGIMNLVDGMATNSVYFWPNRTTEAYKGYQVGRRINFRTSDIDLIMRKAKTVDGISPLLFGGGQEKSVVHGQKTSNYRYRGVYPYHFEVEGVKLLKGRLLNEIDVSERRKVCLIGKEVYETLFDVDEDPIGKYIRISGSYFIVAGVIAPRTTSSNFTGNMDRLIFMPLSTMQQMFNRGDRIHNLILTTKKGFSAKMLEDEVTAILKEAHEISPTDDKAIMSQNIEESFKQFTGLVTGVNVLIWIVGLGALFSGIVGISNIMLVTVRERMREIGVRRALGATPLRIIVQVLSESFVLTALAGLIGFLLGVAVLEVIQSIMSVGGGESEGMLFDPPSISFHLAVVAMVILVISGIAAGFLPAMRALKVKAIDAIRDE